MVSHLDEDVVEAETDLRLLGASFIVAMLLALKAVNPESNVRAAFTGSSLLSMAGPMA